MSAPSHLSAVEDSAPLSYKEAVTPALDGLEATLGSLDPGHPDHKLIRSVHRHLSASAGLPVARSARPSPGRPMTEEDRLQAAREAVLRGYQHAVATLSPARGRGAHERLDWFEARLTDCREIAGLLPLRVVGN